MGFKPRLNKGKASSGCHRFSEEIYRASSIKSGRKYAKAHLIFLRSFKRPKGVLFYVS
ncbi:hypothetical protein [Siminovitchia terrae]|uniref:hypothetical protein n=1 Tax=Siminovitchia terrae TaxID=1914933 RepID=UPI001BB403D8|nr:hypothetical protein [Siminovitchia terrae]